jgi:hypothetical protein
MTSEQQGPEEREAVLSRLRKRMARAARRKDMGRYAELRAEHDRLKDEHVMASHAEVKAAMRARRAAERAQRPVEAPRRWRLPAGFGMSPLARERARQGRPEVPVIPVGRPVLSPWRRGNPATEVIWRPGR